MVEVKLTREIAASSDAVWAVLEDFGNLSWIGMADSVEVIGEGIGQIRRINMEGMDPIDEKLESMDVGAKTLSYSIVKNQVIPFEDYLAKVRVEGVGDSATVYWTSTFDECDMPAADAQALIEGSYNMLLDGLTAAASA